MKVFIRKSQDYINSMSIGDMAVLKLCLLSLGAIIGMFIPILYKDFYLGFLVGIFICTYIASMSKYLKVLLKKDNFKQSDNEKITVSAPILISSNVKEDDNK